VRVTGAWIREHGDLVRIVLISGAVILGLGFALVVLGQAIRVVGTAITALRIAFSVGHAVFGIVAQVLAFLCTPVGLVTAAIVAAVLAVLYFTGALKALGDWIGSVIGGVLEDCRQAFGGISDALAAGDIPLAMKILWLLLKLEFQKGVNWLLEQWYTFKTAFVDIALKAWFGAQAGLTIAWGWLERAWINTTSFLSTAWVNFVAGLKSVWNTTQNWLSKRWIDVMGLFGSLTAEEVRRAKQGLDEGLSRELGKIGLELEAKEKAIKDRQTAKLQESEEMQSATLAVIGSKYEAAENARKAKFQKEISSLDEELAATRAEFDAARAQAAQERRDAEAKRQKRLGGKGGGAGLDAAAVTVTTGVAGTFNALMARGLSAGGPTQALIEQGRAQKSELEKVNKNLGILHNDLEEAGVWG
jgi:hypothetical protein